MGGIIVTIFQLVTSSSILDLICIGGIFSVSAQTLLAHKAFLSKELNNIAP